MPPVRSGIAQYSRELLPALASSCRIDVFVDGPPARRDRAEAGVTVHDAHDFVWKHRRNPYDLIVYQLGNAPCHDYMWPYLVRHPGLVVLHDGQLHHARARALLQAGRDDDYRSEFRFDHPDANVDLAELGVAGLLGSMTYFWPMRRVVLRRARLTMVHNRWLAGDIEETEPGARVTVVEMGVPAAAPADDARERVRSRHGISLDAVLFVAFGKVTPEKRISQAIHALAAIADAAPESRLLLAGETVDYYDPLEEARRLGVADRVIVAGFVADDEVDDYLAASDVCLCLRWPSSRETSASWLRCLAAGRPSIVTDLVHTADVATLDPRSWADVEAPACVGIDIMDEDHSLRLAMRRLASDARLRAALGRQARELWGRRFTLDAMIEGYRKTIDEAAAAPPPDISAQSPLPPHLLADGSELTHRLLAQMGAADPFLRDRSL